MIRCRARKRSFPARRRTFGWAWPSAGLGSGFRSLLKAILAVISTPIVQAEWQQLLAGRLSGRPADVLAGDGKDSCTDARGRLRIVCCEEKTPGLLECPAQSSSDHTVCDGPGHGVA